MATAAELMDLSRVSGSDLARAESSLAEMEREFDSAPDASTDSQSELPGNQTPEPTTESQPNPTGSKPGTPATSEPPAATTPPANEQQQQQRQEPGSKFAKAEQRRKDSWADLNREKEAFRTQQKAIEGERAALLAEQSKWKREQDARQKNRVTPEAYDQAAIEQRNIISTGELQLEGLKARQKRLEDEGNYTAAAKVETDAKQLEKKLAVAEHNEAQYKAMADNLRKNPDPTEKQVLEKRQGDIRHYLLEAAKKWPDVAVNGSAFQKAMAGGINTLFKAGIDARELPSLHYFVAEHVATQTEAARVPALEKELGELRAKVKEYESLTSPGGGSSVSPLMSKPAKPASLESEEEELRNAAAAGAR